MHEKTPEIAYFLRLHLLGDAGFGIKRNSFQPGLLYVVIYDDLPTVGNEF